MSAIAKESIPLVRLLSEFIIFAGAEQETIFDGIGKSLYGSFACLPIQFMNYNQGITDPYIIGSIYLWLSFLVVYGF